MFAVHPGSFSRMDIHGCPKWWHLVDGILGWKSWRLFGYIRFQGVDFLSKIWCYRNPNRNHRFGTKHRMIINLLYTLFESLLKMIFLVPKVGYVSFQEGKVKWLPKLYCQEMKPWKAQSLWWASGFWLRVNIHLLLIGICFQRGTCRLGSQHLGGLLS